jgi:hypothetical protein
VSSTKQANIAKHVIEVLREEMGVMQMQLWDMTLEQDALSEELATCQTKCLGLKQNVAIQ